MRKTLIRTALAAMAFFCATGVNQAQVEVTSGIAPETVVNDYLIGEGLKVRNVKFTGDPRALGVFENAGDHPGMKKGILLSTGRAEDAAGPNDNPKTSTSLGRGGNKELYELAKGRTFDASVLEFEFMAARDSVTLNFMYASEEYNDYVGSTFNDAFTIRIFGPGFQNGRELGMIPETTTPINVNTVNYNTNGRFYEDNNPFTLAGRLNEKRKAELNQELLENFQYDGMTVVFSVGTQVKPRETYRIQIAIADAGDGNMDSGLFIEGESLKSIEQYRWVLRREKIAEKRRLDSLARVAFVEDSLAQVQAIEDSIAAVRAEEARLLELENLEQWEDDAENEELEAEEEDMGDIEEGDDMMEDDAEMWEEDEGELEEEEDGEYYEEEVEEESADEETVAATNKYETVIRYAREDFLVPQDSEGMLSMFATYVKEHPGARLGIYIPAADDTSKLRYDMVKAELFKSGLKPDQIFQNTRSFLTPENAGGIHRVEIVVQ